MGDFNTDLLGQDTYDEQQLITMFYSQNRLLSLIALHHTDHSNTLIDLLVVSDSTEIAYNSQLSAHGISKHVFCNMFIKSHCHSMCLS